MSAGDGQAGYGGEIATCEGKRIERKQARERGKRWGGVRGEEKKEVRSE